MIAARKQPLLAATWIKTGRGRLEMRWTPSRDADRTSAVLAHRASLVRLAVQLHALRAA